MTALLLSLGLFAGWWIVGMALFGAIRASTRELRIALAAPALGSAVTVVPLFVVSNFGIPMADGGRPVCLALAAVSLVILAIRQPRLPLAIAPVLVVCVINLVLVGRPMFQFGLNWIANANGDMAYYVLSATSLLHRGLLSPVDTAGLLKHIDLASAAQTLHQAGVGRAGADITLSALSATTGLSLTALYMPLTLSLSLCGLCAVGALAMQATPKSWGATLAAVLLAVSPLAAYGVLQQLLPQVWGLALATALAALLMRPEIHGGPVRANLPQYIAISLLTAGLCVVYPELAASLLVAYGLYVALLATKGKVSARAVAVLWTSMIALSVLVLNTFLSHALHYIATGARNGVNGTGGVRLFGYSLVPSALPGIIGLQLLSAAPSTRFMSESIIVAAIYLAVVLAASVVAAPKGMAAPIVVLSDFGLGVLLAYHKSDFGLFKLYMYAQPFLAASIAVFFTYLKSRYALALAGVLMAALVSVQVETQRRYVGPSFNAIDLPHASDSDLLPTFRSVIKSEHDPVLSASDNLILEVLEGAIAGDHPLYFLSRNAFAGLPLRTYHFRTNPGSTSNKISFPANPETLRILSGGHCTVVISTGSQVAVNRRVLPEGSSDLAPMTCTAARNLLVFTVSREGQPFTIPGNSKAVSFWQLEGDPSFPGHTLSGFGRYALFAVLGPTPNVHVALDFTTSYAGGAGRSFRLPPAAVVGGARAPLPIIGAGSARVISPPLHPQMIGGVPYVLLDMGEQGAFPAVPRPGVAGLWGKSVLLDPRKITSSVRDVSLMSDAQYRRLSRPASIEHFPTDLGNPNLEYSGIFEDGWVGARSYAVLSSANSTMLIVRLQALARRGQHLDVLLDGKKVASRDIAGGKVEIRVHAPASKAARRVELRFTGVSPLHPPDRRSAAALLEFLGFGTP